METTDLRTNPVRNRTLLIFALIFTFCLPSLWAGLMGDDYMHYAILSAKDLPIEKPHDLSLFGLFSFINGDPERNRQAMDLGVIPWWTYSGMKYAFWRPISELTHWVDHQLWPRTPALMHLQSVLWYLALCFLAFKLYRKTLVPAGAALLALALFGLDSTHGFGISWIANRNGLISAVFGMACFLTYIRWRESGNRLIQLLSMLLMLITLLSAELGISTFGYIAAYALCCDPKGRVKGLLAAAPHFLTVMAWWLLYKSAGFGAANADGYYIDPATHPLKFISMLLERYPVLLASQWGLVPAEVYGYSANQSINFVVASAFYLLVVLGFVIAACIRNANLRMWLLGMFFSLVPATTAIPQDRVLIFAGIGASAALSHFLYTVFKTDFSFRPLPRWSAKFVGGILVLFHLILAPLLLPVTSYSTKLIWSRFISQKPSELTGISDIQNKKLVIIGTPLTDALSIAPFRFYRGEPIPDKIWLITSLDEEFKLERIDDHSVLLTIESGFIQGAEVKVRDFLRFPFKPNDEVFLTGLTIKIGELNDRGMPISLTLTFKEDLDSDNLLFVHWNADKEAYDILHAN